MSRRKYATISDLDQQRIINAFLENRDWLYAAETLGIKRQTAKNKVKFRRIGHLKKEPRDGNRRNKTDNEMQFFFATSNRKKTY